MGPQRYDFPIYFAKSDIRPVTLVGVEVSEERLEEIIVLHQDSEHAPSPGFGALKSKGQEPSFLLVPSVLSSVLGDIEKRKGATSFCLLLHLREIETQRRSSRCGVWGTGCIAI